MYKVITLLKLAREFAGDDLLTAALDGKPRSPDTVSELYLSAVQNFGRDTQSDVTRKYWIACGTYLANAGLAKEELQKLRRPHPVSGEPGFRSILDEMREEGHDV